MSLKGSVARAWSDIRVMTAICLSLSVALPVVMYQTAQWRLESSAYAKKLEREAALKVVSVQAAEHIKEWSDARNRLPLPGADLAETGDAESGTAKMGVSIDNQRMSRVEADRVLEGLARNTDGLFVPDAFLIHAAKPGDGIFTRNTAEDFPNSLVLTIKGEFISRDIQ